MQENEYIVVSKYIELLGSVNHLADQYPFFVTSTERLDLTIILSTIIDILDGHIRTLREEG